MDSFSLLSALLLLAASASVPASLSQVEGALESPLAAGVPASV